MVAASEKIEIENVNTPGRVERVDKRKFTAMRDALLKALPNKMPGLTVAEAKAARFRRFSPDYAFGFKIELGGV